jgi:hypothetical protein
MLYDISIFWDQRHPAKAVPLSAGSTHWVQVGSSESAKTTIYVASSQDADDLAELINRICTAPASEREAA